MEQYYYISGSTVILSGSSVTVLLPTTKTPKAIIMRAEGGAVYYDINPVSGSATTTSPGYVPQDQVGLVPEISNLKTFCVYGASGASIHLQYLTF
jgi:hypothetical protein